MEVTFQCMPMDLARQVLLRLPVKSLLRLCAVCKILYDLISSKAFINDHLAVAKNSDFFFLRYREFEQQKYFLCPDDRFGANWESAEKLTPTFLDTVFSYLDVGYCNGVVCVLIYSRNKDGRMNPGHYAVLWNPSIRKHLTIRTTQDKRARGYIFGFGYDSVSGDYKLVNIYGSGKIQADECCLRDGKWKTQIASIGRRTFSEFWNFESPIGRSVFLNGKCHWLIEDTPRISQVISFDLHSRVFNKIVLPDCLTVGDSTSLHVFEGCLSLCVDTRDHNKDRISLWMMKDCSVGGSWTKVFESQNLVSIDKVFGLRRRGEVVYCRRNQQLVSYDPVKQRVHNSKAKVAEGLGLFFDAQISYCLDVYKETLALLDETGREGHEDQEAEELG